MSAHICLTNDADTFFLLHSSSALDLAVWCEVRCVTFVFLDHIIAPRLACPIATESSSPSPFFFFRLLPHVLQKKNRASDTSMFLWIYEYFHFNWSSGLCIAPSYTVKVQQEGEKKWNIFIRHNCFQLKQRIEVRWEIFPVLGLVCHKSGRFCCRFSGEFTLLLLQCDFIQLEIEYSWTVFIFLHNSAETRDWLRFVDRNYIFTPKCTHPRLDRE